MEKKRKFPKTETKSRKATKAKSPNRILQGAREALAYVSGEADVSQYRVHVPADIDVAAIRRSLRISQDKFAARFGIPSGTLRDWEQGRSKPDGAARVLLMVIAKEPEAVQRALEAA